MLTNRKLYRLVVCCVLVSLLLPLASIHSRVRADGLFDDLTPNEYTFTGRRGSHSFTASWDPQTYEVRITTPDGTFPWDWISFVSPDGAISLNGLPNVGETFSFSSPSSLTGAAPGDVIRVKGRDVHNLAHLTKLGLVIGSGPTAQRAWFSQGTITAYLLAPDYVGYEATVLGRAVTVRLFHLAPAPFQPVGVFEVTLDDPTNARLILASDLEPALSYTYAIEFRDTPDTMSGFDIDQQAVVGYATLNTSDERLYNQPVPVYLYSDQPLHSWSASNLSFGAYLAADTLDGQIAAGANDGRSAISIPAQLRQRFYIGAVVLDAALRADPTSSMATLRQTRLDALHQLPIVDAPDLPAFKFVTVISNLFNSYLINLDGKVFAVDKAIVYAPDTLTPPVVVPELLPDSWIAAFQDMLVEFADYQYTAGGQGRYWWKLDGTGHPRTSEWYVGNIVDTFFFLPDGRVAGRWQFSDAYSTAEFIQALAGIYRTTGDLAYLRSLEGDLDAALAALQTFDSAYDALYGEDGNLFPNLLYPMADLSQIQGEYPAESGQVIAAYEDGATLLDALGRTSEANHFRQNLAAPMRAAFDATFWNESLGFYAPVADQRSQTHSAGQFYLDKWCQTLLPLLLNAIDNHRLPEMLAVYTDEEFYEPTNDVHWLSTDSETFTSYGDWTNGFVMQGGFFDGIPPVLSPIGYYQLDQFAQGDHYANVFLNRWVNLGPYESMMESNYQLPGRYQETSIYIEGTLATTWLFKAAMGLQVDGMTVTVAPGMRGTFAVRNVRVTVAGLSAIFDYARDDEGAEYIQVTSNEGLTINAPNAGPTAVTLTSFEAAWQERSVLVTWETAMELDNLGFNLYRGASAAGPWTRLNAALIPPKHPGEVFGSPYEWRDGDVASTIPVYYRLEDVDIYGRSSYHGPISVTGVSRTVYHVYLPLALRHQQSGSR